MKFGSLFSGIAGFDLGFEQSGLGCEWQVESDNDCNRVLANRFPNVSRYADVKDVGKLPTVDLICGGFPCQDLSVAGKRKGLAGERSGLWFEFLRIIESNLPRWIVIENVPGLLSSDESRDFAAILRGLVDVGYRLAWRVLDAQYYGVAQRRRRVFIVGSLGDGSCAQILFESESVSWNPPTRREAGERTASAVTTGTGKSSGPRNGNGDPLNLLYHENIDGKVYGSDQCPALRNFQKDAPMIAATLDQRGRGPTDAAMMNLQVARPLAHSQTANHHDESRQTYAVAEALRTKRPGEGGIADDDTHIVASALMGHSGLHDSGGQQAFITHALRSEGADGSEDGTGRGTPIIAAPLTANYGKQLDNSDHNGGPPNLISAFELHHDEHGGRGANFKPTETNPSLRGPNGTDNTLLGNSFGVRRLTPTECERLQGFPDGWTSVDGEGKAISDSARYRMLGNAVAVPVAKWIGERLMEFA